MPRSALGDERNFAHFRESGLDPREWALKNAWRRLPRSTFCFIQVTEKWWDDHARWERNTYELEPVRITNTDPATVASYFPSCQMRAWQCVYENPGDNPAVIAMEAGIKRL